MDLIRKLLMEVEKGDFNRHHSIEGYSLDEVFYHANLVLEHRLAVGPEPVRKGFRGFARVDLDRLTWEGHDFLEAARDDTVWATAKEKFMKPGASWTFDLLKEWLKMEIKQRLALP